MYLATESEARLYLSLIPGLGPRRIQRLLQYFGEALAALAAPEALWSQLGIPKASCEARQSTRVEQQMQETLRWLAGENRHVVLLGTPEYPALLAEIPDAPPLLYLEGALALLERPQIAVVGSRHASRAGLEQAEAFARDLAATGFVVTSGLALGIDGAAHRGALKGSGHTVAVLGTGLQRLYPTQHRSLAADVLAQGGVLVSELPINTPPMASNFPRRNRIISGLSLGVLVVEATPSSGSLITARLAAEQGREVFAIPGSIHHPGARGCHQLIREGALLVEQVADVLEALRGWQHSVGAGPWSEVVPTAPEEAEDHPLLAHLRASPLSTETLAALSNWPLPQVLIALTELELDGRIQCEAGLWTLVRS